MVWIVIIGYMGAMGMVCLFSFHQLNLALIYRRKKAALQPEPLSVFPKVTVQLPVYNEKYVVERLIDAICRLDYPKEMLEIQILDDSTDETSDLIKSQILQWAPSGLDLQHIQRRDRTGYKAGALQHGLGLAKGEFIAIFDADFLPKADFLQKTLPYFSEKVGMVQTRWGHLNERYSLLTRMQAFGLNAHFSVEQKGRESSGKFMNFNGTAGVWRKTCIEDAGGWQADTLTEDLDLSYRAQLKGWKFQYLEHLMTPAELPVLIPAIKSQQYRWNKGAAETARKHLGTILRAPLGFQVKLHAVFHLFNSSVFLFALIAALLSVPMLYAKGHLLQFDWLFDLASIFLLGFLAIGFYYWVSSAATATNHSIRTFLVDFPMFLAFSMGLTLHNSIAVMEGFLGVKTPFVRTPKFNIIQNSDQWKGNQYLLDHVTPGAVTELILACYFLFGVVSAFMLRDYGLLLFHVMLVAGFGSVAYLSLKPTTGARV